MTQPYDPRFRAGPPPGARPLPPPGKTLPPPGKTLPPPGVAPLPPPGVSRGPMPFGPPTGPQPMPPTGGIPLPPPGAAPLPPPMAGPPPMYAPPVYPPRFGYPPKKSNTGVIVAVALIGVVVVFGGLIAALALGGRSHHVAEPGYSTYPTPTYTTPTYSTYRPTYTTPRTTARTSATAAPTTQEPAGPQPVHKTRDNPLLTNPDAGLPNAPCKLARWANNPQAAQAFFESARPCLDRVWQQALNDAGLPFEPPALAFPSGQWSSPCGDSENGRFAAFYCGKNHTLYMPYDSIQVPQYGAHPGVYLALFAHEYGHHGQTMAGIMDAYWDQRYDAGPDSAAGLELSRRNELQAQCFSGMFLGSAHNRGGDVDDNIYREAWQSQDRGDHNGGPRDHGSDDHAISWWQQGAVKNRFAQCNTYNTDSANVS